MARRGKQAEGDGSGNLERLHGVSPNIFLPTPVGPIEGETDGEAGLIHDRMLEPHNQHDHLDEGLFGVSAFRGPGRSEHNTPCGARLTAANPT